MSDDVPAGFITARGTIALILFVILIAYVGFLIAGVDL